MVSDAVADAVAAIAQHDADVREWVRRADALGAELVTLRETSRVAWLSVSRGIADDEPVDVATTKAMALDARLKGLEGAILALTNRVDAQATKRDLLVFRHAEAESVVVAERLDAHLTQWWQQARDMAILSRQIALGNQKLASLYDASKPHAAFLTALGTGIPGFQTASVPQPTNWSWDDFSRRYDDFWAPTYREYLDSQSDDLPEVGAVIREAIRTVKKVVTGG